jgi:predicted phosphodiesterase
MVYTRPMLACLYDVHGNLAALEAVLDDAEAQGATRWILGGDYALFGAWPKETVQRLRTLDNAIWIRGNGERWTAHPNAAPDNPVIQGAIASVRATLGPELVAAMGDIESLAHDRDAVVCHGSPPSDVRSFFPEPADDEAELLDGVVHPRVLFGHTHLPFRRISEVRGIELINPGSVGMPFDGDTRASYALLHRDHTVEHRRVEYDHQATIARLRELGEPWTEVAAKRVEQARPDV